MPLRLWRITTGFHPIWSGEGARLFGQRWNPPGVPAIYTGTSFAVALLEVLVHANRQSPPSGARFVEAVVPDEVSREEFDSALHPGWNDPDALAVAQAFGRDWIRHRRTALLLVPSVVTGGIDFNAIVNPEHPESTQIAVSPEKRVVLDKRIFG
ncbi:MAG: RES domain-containing protein [Hyphomicrobiales bacterium]|nr:RES domain-containing protein [Hyphomicrobiales bacterium]